MSQTGSTTGRDLPRTAPVVHARERIRTWRLGTFGPASEEPYRRRPSDYLRVAIAVLIVAATCLHEGDLTTTEHDLFVLFNRLPDSLQSLFEVVYGAGALWAVGLLVAAAFLARRRRLSRDLATSAFVAWTVGRLLGVIVGGHDTLGEGLKVLIRLDDSPSFPVVRLAVVTAVICAAAPYVTRPTRRVGQGLVLCLALAALYLGTGFPNGVFAAVVLGWGVAAAVHLVFGSPGGRPTRAQVTDALTELGLDVDEMWIAPYTREDGTVMFAATPREPFVSACWTRRSRCAATQQALAFPHVQGRRVAGPPHENRRCPTGSVRAAPRRAGGGPCAGRPRSRERRPWNRAPRDPCVRRGPARRRRRGQRSPTRPCAGMGRGSSAARGGRRGRSPERRPRDRHVARRRDRRPRRSVVRRHRGPTSRRHRRTARSLAVVVGNERAVTTAGSRRWARTRWRARCVSSVAGAERRDASRLPREAQGAPTPTG